MCREKQLFMAFDIIDRVTFFFCFIFFLCMLD